MGDTIGDQEQQVQTLKRLLEGWRYVVAPLRSVILWEKHWHPAAILETMAFIIFFIWLLDMNFLTTLAVMGLIVNALDFSVPAICNYIYSPSSWTDEKEKAFEDICREMVANYNNMTFKIRSFCSLRKTRPGVYYIISISMLLVIAGISTTVNNIFLVYIFLTVFLLWPGLRQHRLHKIVLSLIRKTPKTGKSK